MTNIYIYIYIYMERRKGSKAVSSFSKTSERRSEVE